MTNEEAKFMLQGYRPNGADADNEAFAQALAQAQRDPALREWFEREQAFDTVVAGKLRSIQPPPGLRESILAGKKMTPSQATESARPWWAQTWTIGLAAAAAIVMVFSVALTRPATEPSDNLVTMEPIIKLAMADLGGAHGPGPYASALGTIGAWIMDANNRLHADSIPVDLDKLRAMGCRTVTVAGHEVFEICFERESGWYHLYIVDRENCDPVSLHRDPMFHEKGDFVAASWACEKYAYLVAGGSDLATLRGLL